MHHLLPGFASNLAMIVSGRIVTGICCGFVSLTIPTYIGEIASPDIRGLLGKTHYGYSID